MPGRVTRASASTLSKAANSNDVKAKPSTKQLKPNQERDSRTETKAKALANGKNDSLPGSDSANRPKGSLKRARNSIKEESISADAIKNEPESTPSPPSKRSKKSNQSTAAKQKPEPDLEAGAKLAKSLLQPGQSSESSPTKTKTNPYNLSPGVSPYPSYPHPTPAACYEVRDRLAAIHGTVSAPTTIPTPNLQSSGCGEVPSVLDALIRTRLSANTNNANSSRAFRGLVDRFGVLAEGVGKGSVDWDAVRRSDVSELFEAIKSGGLASVKSKDIKAILELVYQENLEQAEKKDGKENGILLSLDHLHSMSSEDAFAKLLGYPGIGPKTASCVLLFCMQRPSFAVDTHVFRLTRWLGWTPSDAEVRRMGKGAKATESPAKQESGGSGAVKGRAPPPVSRNTTYSHLDVRIPDELKYPLHYLLIKHGKTCPSCMAKRDGKVKEAWGKKVCPIKDLKRGSRKEIKKELGEDAVEDDAMDEETDEDED